VEKNSESDVRSAITWDNFDFERFDPDALAGRLGVKWSRDGPEVLAAWVADMDFPVAPAIIERLLDVVQRQDFGYPGPDLDSSVRVAFAERSAERYGFVVDPDLVVITTEVVQAIYAVLMSCTAPDDPVVIVTPAYPPFFAAVRDTGRRTVLCPMAQAATGPVLDTEALRAAVLESGARALLLCNPHNPTGRVFARAELEAVAALAEERDLLVIADEIHADIVFEGSMHVPIASLSQAIAERTVTLSSTSKGFNLAGLRCAVAAFGGRALRDRFDSLPAHVRGSSSVLGMVATLAAWQHGGPWLEAVMEQLSRNREIVRSAVARLAGVRHVQPEGTYLAWLDFAATPIADDPAGWLRENARVALAPGIDFGATGAAHARLNFATPRPILLDLLERIETAYAGIDQR